ncbi:hypothetical protein N7465_004655 [Penicillium sp. CMV-2018d]|nr:hypothetical protein N7465_004655 [Penicillium sp. CMV-2018d]
MTLHTRSTSNSSIVLVNTIRLDAHSDIGLSWYLSILSFKQTIEELNRDEYDPSNTSNTNAVTWYTTMLATFPLTILDCKHR